MSMNFDTTELDELTVATASELQKKDVSFDDLLAFSALVVAVNIISSCLVDGDSPIDLALCALEIAEQRISDPEELKVIERMIDKLEEEN